MIIPEKTPIVTEPSKALLKPRQVIHEMYSMLIEGAASGLPNKGRCTRASRRGSSQTTLNAGRSRTPNPVQTPARTSCRQPQRDGFRGCTSPTPDARGTTWYRAAPSVCQRVWNGGLLVFL